MRFPIAPVFFALATLLIVTVPGTTACASSISTAATEPSAAPPALSKSTWSEASSPGLSLAEVADPQTALELAAAASLVNPQPLVALPLEEPLASLAWHDPSSAAPTYLSAAAFPLTVSDVPEPTAFGLLLLGLAGLLIARRVARAA